MEDSRRAAHAAAAAEEEEAAERAIPSAAAAPATPAVADPAAVGAGTGVPTGVPTAATLADLEAERALHHRRAERFGGEYVDPAKKPGPLRDVERRARLERKDGFVTGIDLFAEEERARIAARAARFGNIAPSSAAAASASAAIDTANAPPPLSGTAVPIRNVAYAPDEDELKKRARAARFQTPYGGGVEGGLMEVDLLEERRPLPPPGAVARRPEAIHVYGVDVLSTSDILRYFSEWGPTFVEWLDDSSANVIFADEFTAKRALVGRGKPLPPDDSAAAAEEGGDFASASASLDPTDIKNAPFLWHKGDDATKAGTGVPIVYRMATVLDVKPPKGTKVSRGLWRMRPSDALSTVRKGAGGAGKSSGGVGGTLGGGGGRRRGGGRNRRRNDNSGGDVSMSEVLESAGKVTKTTATGGGGGSAE